MLVPCRDARDLSRPPEIWVCVARSPAICQGVCSSASETASKGQCTESPSSTQDSTSEYSAGVWHAQHHVRPTTAAPAGRCNNSTLCSAVSPSGVADRYPVQSYLHRCRKVQSPHCPYCPGQDETLAHFTTLCPRFREARTAGHNRVRAKLASLLAKCLDAQWQLFEETPMRNTGLELQTVSAACMVEAGRLAPGDHSDSVCMGNLQHLRPTFQI